LRPVAPQRSTLQNAAFVLGGQLGARTLALLLYAVLARSLGTEYYGDIGVGTAFGVIASVLLEPGLNALIIRDGARDPRVLSERAGDSLTYKLTLLLPVWLGIGGLGYAMGYRGSTLQAIWLCGGTQLLMALEDLCASTLIGRDRMDLEGTLRVSSKLLFTMAGLGALALHLSFALLLGAMLAAQAMTALVGLGLVWRSGLRLSPRPVPARILALLKLGWPLAIAGVLWQVTLRLDQVLASQLHVPRSDLGDYNAAVKLVEALILFPNALVTSFAPVLARAFTRGAAALAVELHLVLESAFLVTAPIVVGGALLAGDVGTLVYGARFSGVGPLLAVQLFALLFIAVQFAAFTTLVAAGELRGQSLVVGANLAVNVVANLILVPRLGVLGASLAAVAGGVAGALASVWTLRRIAVAPGLLRAAWRPALAVLVMAGVVWQVRLRLGFYAALPAGAVSYGLAVLALGGKATVVALRSRRSGLPTPPLHDPA
jgi:O-antigen/teichoic acid export membrane protein